MDSLDLDAIHVNSFQQVIFQTDVEGIWTFLNPAWTEITGFSIDKSLGRNFLDYIHPYDRQKNIDEFVKLVSGEKKYYQLEIRYLTSSGRVRWMRVKARLIFDKDGKITGTSGTLLDITESILAEQELVKSEQKYRSLFEYNPDAVFSLSLNGAFLSANEATVKITGYSISELMDMTLVHLISKEDLDLVMECFGRAVSGEPQDLQAAMRHKDGRRVDVHITTVPIIVNGEVTGIYGIAKDITERKRVEEALIAAKEEAERANEAKSHFLSSMSHELRTPMNAILGFAQILKYDPLEPLTQFQQESVDHIINAGKHLLNLINDVLDLSRIESGALMLTLESVSISDVVEKAISLILPMAKEKKIAIVNQIPQTGELFVKADSPRLKQSLVNLLSNAVKYNRPNGTVTLTCEVMDKGRIQLGVIDTGVGIPEKQLESIFEPFNRLGAERKNIEGTGIGLTITKRIIDLMGGGIEVTSKVGEGSSFYLILPAADSSAAISASPELPESRSAESLEKQHTILYIEDNPSNLSLVEQILARTQGVRLLAAPQAGIGIELAKAHLPDLILLDIHLPDMDGFEALAQLSSDPLTREIPVMAVSANAMPRDIEQGLKAGFVRYITKPIMIPQFLEAIYSVLNTKDRQ